MELPEGILTHGTKQRWVIGNYEAGEHRCRRLRLRPYESFVLHLSD